MRSAPWDRRVVIAQVRTDIWRYLTQAAKTTDDVLLDAAALLQMRPSEVRTLAQLQFILSAEVGDLLSQMPVLLRKLTTTTTEELETSAERVRGSIRWSETLAARAATGVPHVFVTAPTRRAYDTPENELLVFALESIRSFGRRTGWHRSTSSDVGDEVRRRVAAAVRWRRARALADMPLRQPMAKTISRVRAGRNRRTYQTVLEVIELYRRFLARLDRSAIREAVETHALVTSRDPVLLELLCAFTTMSTLRDSGWIGSEPRLLRPPRILQAKKGDRVIDLYYQHAPSDLTNHSVYRELQRTHRFAAVGGLVPDLVMHIKTPNSVTWLMIEVKGVERTVEQSARAATVDLLAYRRAFHERLDAQQQPYGIGVAWGRELQPAHGAEIILCTPDTIGDALEIVLA